MSQLLLKYQISKKLCVFFAHYTKLKPGHYIRELTFMKIEAFETCLVVPNAKNFIDRSYNKSNSTGKNGKSGRTFNNNKSLKVRIHGLRHYEFNGTNFSSLYYKGKLKEK